MNQSLTFDPSHRVLALGIVDYIVVLTMLLVSSAIGLYFRFSGDRQRTVEEYLLAGRDMSVLPVAFSVMASGKSAITYLGVPADMYTYGTHFAFINLGSTAGALVAGYLFLPVYFGTKSSSIYEYLEKRFGKTLRRICSFCFSIQVILYIAVCLYAPALALSAVTSLSIWTSVISVGVVCTFYCTLGGMKAVLWTDVFQATLMYVGLIAMVAKGCFDVGGVQTVLDRANEGGRLIVPGFELDLTTRYTLPNIFLYGFCTALSAYGASQMQVQRMLTVSSVRKARIALFSSLPIIFIFHVVNCFAGLVLYANYYECDPLTSGENVISKPDQLLPYFSLTSLGAFPGLPGLCVCGMLGAALSTLSSMVNSLATVTVEDFIRPACGGFGEKRTALVAKLTTLAYGMIGLLLTYVVANFGNVLQASTIVYGLVAGPTLGIFLLGILTARTNEKGAIFGLVVSLVFTAWISFGGAATNIAHARLPVSTAGCPANGSALQPHTASNWTTSEPQTPREYIFPLFTISYMWFTPIAVLTTLVFGYLSSYFFSKPESIEDRLLNPIVRRMLGRKTPEEQNVQLTSLGCIQNRDAPNKENKDKL